MVGTDALQRVRGVGDTGRPVFGCTLRSTAESTRLPVTRVIEGTEDLEWQVPCGRPPSRTPRYARLLED